MTTYRHTQSGRALLFLLVGAACVTCIIAMSLSDARIAFVPAVVLFFSALLFWRLTITIDNKVFRASFGPGLISKEVSIGEIEHCEPIRTRWWHGWGIHLTENGWLYNVAGWDAVMITLRDGRRFCVGTDEPQEVQAAVRRFASAR